LDRHVDAGDVGSYYESVFSEMIAEGAISLEPVLFDHERWYEVDTLADLEEAERIFLDPMHGLPSQGLC
jgi:NDP-sugar pyrophosphorylase family protein